MKINIDKIFDIADNVNNFIARTNGDVFGAVRRKTQIENVKKLVDDVKGTKKDSR